MAANCAGGINCILGDEVGSQHSAAQQSRAQRSAACAGGMNCILGGGCMQGTGEHSRASHSVACFCSRA